MGGPGTNLVTEEPSHLEGGLSGALRDQLRAETIVGVGPCGPSPSPESQEGRLHFSGPQPPRLENARVGKDTPQFSHALSAYLGLSSGYATENKEALPLSGAGWLQCHGAASCRDFCSPDGIILSPEMFL